MRIVLFLYDGLTTLDIIGPHDVLARLPNAEVLSVALDHSPKPADTGVLGITPSHTIDEIDSYDVIVVPGGVAGTFAAAADPRITDWLARTAATATWVTSVCTGSLILGAAGLLTQRRATSHWGAVGLLADHDALPVDNERVVVDGNVMTAAGVSAGIDMALRLAAELSDELTAQSIQLAIEYDPEPPYSTGSRHRAPAAIVERASRLWD